MLKWFTEMFLEIAKDQRKVLYVSALFLVLMLSVQSIIWITGGYNSSDMYAHQHEARVLIDNDFSWSLRSAAGNIANPHMPVIIYLLAALYCLSSSWVLSYIAIMILNAALAFIFIHRLGYNLTGDGLLASYTTLFFVTMTGFGGIHGIFFPLADTLGLTFIIMTLYALTSKKPRYLLAGTASLLTFFSHFYSGMALFSLLLILFFFNMFDKNRISVLKKYLLPGVCSLIGLGYYTLIYTQLSSEGNVSAIGLGSASMLSALKSFNFMQFPFIFGFIHMFIAFVGLIIVLNKYKSIREFLSGGYTPAIVSWSVLIIIPTQLPFLFMSLPLYRLLSYLFITIAILASFGFKELLNITKSTISRTTFFLVIILYIFITPFAHNIYAMDPVIDQNERAVLNCVTETVSSEEHVFVVLGPMIYFSAVTDRLVAFDNPVKYYEIVELMESYNVLGARDEILNMNVEYVYTTRDDIATSFSKLDGVETICSSGDYYLFKI